MRITRLLISVVVLAVLVLFGTWCYASMLKTGNDPVGLENSNIKIGMCFPVLKKQLGEPTEVIPERMSSSVSAYYEEELFGRPCKTYYSFHRRFGITSLNEVTVIFQGLSSVEYDQLFETIQSKIKAVYRMRVDYYEDEILSDQDGKRSSFGTDNGAVGDMVSIQTTDNQLMITIFHLE